MARILAVKVLMFVLTVNEALRDAGNAQENGVLMEKAVVEPALEALATEQSTEEVEGLEGSSENITKEAANIRPSIALMAALAALAGGTDAFVVSGKPNRLKTTRLNNGLVNGQPQTHFGNAGSMADKGPFKSPQFLNPSAGGAYLNVQQAQKFQSMFGPVGFTDTKGTSALNSLMASEWFDDLDIFYENTKPREQGVETSVFLYTSRETLGGDHYGPFAFESGDNNGAFAFDSAVAKAMLECADRGCNVAFKRVGGVEDASNYLARNEHKFGKIKYCFIGGHGNPDLVNLGGEAVTMGNHSNSVRLANAIKPMLSRDATVVLQSCLTGSHTESLCRNYVGSHSARNFAMEFVRLLSEGTDVEPKIVAYDREIGRMHLNEDFALTGELLPTAEDPHNPNWVNEENLHPFVIKYHDGAFDAHRTGLLETELVVSQDVALAAVIEIQISSEQKCMSKKRPPLVTMFVPNRATDDVGFAEPTDITVDIKGVCISFSTWASFKSFFIEGKSIKDINAEAGTTIKRTGRSSSSRGLGRSRSNSASNENRAGRSRSSSQARRGRTPAT